MCNWDIEKALTNFTPCSIPDYKHLSTVKAPSKIKGVTSERLLSCYEIAALAVKEHGDVYLQIFQRLHNEVETTKQKQSLLNTAFNVANKVERKKNDQ